MNFYRLKKRMQAIIFFLGSFGGCDAHFLDSEETVSEILKGKSIIRFGDGEFGIYKGRGISYQPWSISLKEDFDRIKKNIEENNNSNILLAVPGDFLKVSGIKLMKNRKHVAAWAEARWDFKKNFSQRLVYGDAFLFKRDNKEIYSKIWECDEKHSNIIFIHNNRVYEEMFQNAYNKKTYFVKCPASDAYSRIDDLCEEINKIIVDNNITRDEVQLVISAGPAGKIIAYRYSEKGYMCIDSGHCWDDPLIGM